MSAPSPKFEHGGRIIRDEIRTTASSQQVWEAWTDPVMIAQWFTDRADGKPEVGTTFTWFFDKFGYALPYTVVAAEPGKRFALKWDQPGSGYPPGLLEITIHREGGETRLELVNSGFKESADWNDEYEGIVSGWRMSLAILKHYLENHFGQPKSQFMVLRPAQFEYEQLKPYFLREDFLAKWLTRSGGIGAQGERYTLVLRDSSKMSGRVLAVTPREVTLSWEEMRAAFEMKAFAFGPGKRMVGVRGLCWGMEPARAQQLENEMTPAVERLAAVFAPSASAAS